MKKEKKQTKTKIKSARNIFNNHSVILIGGTSLNNEALLYACILFTHPKHTQLFVHWRQKGEKYF